MRVQNRGADVAPNELHETSIEAAAQERALLDELRAAWRIAPDAPIVVIGQLQSKKVTDERLLYFLEGLEHPETGVGLLYPGLDSVAASAFVPPPEAGRFNVSRQPWMIAELQLSPVEHRNKHKNPYGCVVRRGSLRPLHDIPTGWGVTVSGRDSVRRISEAAFVAIQTQQQELLAHSEAKLAEIKNQNAVELSRQTDELSRLEDSKNSLRQAIEEMRRSAHAESVHAAERKERITNEIHAMKDRLNRLSDLIADKGRRLVALGILDEVDLLALLPPGDTKNEQPSHDFQELLGADFARLAPFVQARLWQTGMLFTQAQLRDFLALLRTHDVIVLAGDSGAGKTSLVRTVAESISGRCTVIPVKPNWTGPEDLLGYYNPIERSYQPTPFLLALQAAQAEPDVPHFICLDEMNLARVEHYFADFLSLLETRKGNPQIQLYTSDEERHAVVENGIFLSIEAEVRSRVGLSDASTVEEMLKNEEANALLHRLGGFKDAESVLLHHARLRRSLAAATRTPTTLHLPANVRIIGTVNIDETTHYLSPKVLDRVHVLRFRNPVLIDWDAVEVEVQTFDADLQLPVRLGTEELGTREDYPPFDRHNPDAALLADLARRYLDPLGIEFGLRAIRQSLHYLRQAYATGIERRAALNNIMLHKVLPKLMLDLGRTAGNGKSRRDILLELRAEVAGSLEGMDHQAVSESSVDALDQVIAAADSNNNIANYWLR
ncbi:MULTISPECIES: McrB family protein [Aeromonas]|uniref:McrB family protein n=1 Tax=Aeromonas TaxID=642 RepID=UPI001C23251A|nr:MULTISPECIES: AAA family ATPase [Aeromonas]QXB97577.1 AAA family ATPase [Aeromonas sp. FDAARGOS 1418]